MDRACSATRAQIMFTMRFVVQWIASEPRRQDGDGRSHSGFFSIGGGVLAVRLRALTFREPRCSSSARVLASSSTGATLYFELRDRGEKQRPA